MPSRIIDIAKAHRDHSFEILQREWLVTNGIAGYASGTICGMVARRYHGLLIAALPAPLGRVVMLNHLSESLVLPDGCQLLIGGEDPGGNEASAEPKHYLTQFRLEKGLPVWTFEAAGCVIEKRLMLVHGQNTTHITYNLLSGPNSDRLALRPSVNFRPQEHNVKDSLGVEYSVNLRGDRCEISGPTNIASLKLHMDSGNSGFVYEGDKTREIDYPTEAERGYDSRGTLWSPGYIHGDLTRQTSATFTVSTEPWETIMALKSSRAFASENERRDRLISTATPAAHQGTAAELVLAADQFVIKPVGRVEDVARAEATGDEVRTVIAGYHWFTDWGRDTMISLEGLTLTTGRHQEASWILHTFGHYVRDGLIPNFVPEGKSLGLYHTADATLWFFHALDRYLEITDDRQTLQRLLPKLVEIADFHLRGTKFGIGVDPADGLLKQGAEGYQLTWMDAKVGDWVVTPRRGKAVEINALWYNALCLLEGWLRESQQAEAAVAYGKHASKARESFNHRFWSDDLGYLFDIVDGEKGDDSACRPNQIFAVSLPHPVLAKERWQKVVEKVRKELLTPMGLRSLSRNHPDYKAQYFGDLHARDAAYHQGTVWAWLIGPFIDAWIKVHPGELKTAHEFLEPFNEHLSHACVGSISEVFDAEAPYTPRGCIAQAWSVAEVLRCWVKTNPENGSPDVEPRQFVDC